MKKRYFEILSDDPEVVAWKVWTRADIKIMLGQEGYSATEENVDTVVQHLKTCYLNALEDCTDSEWAAITYAVQDCKDLYEDKEEEIYV